MIQSSLYAILGCLAAPLSPYHDQVCSVQATSSCQAAAAQKAWLQAASDEYLSIPKIAEKGEVSCSTLTCLIESGSGVSGFNLAKRLLTPAEEESVVEYIMESANCGCPLDHQQIELVVNAILAQKAGTAPKTCGGSWIA